VEGSSYLRNLVCITSRGSDWPFDTGGGWYHSPMIVTSKQACQPSWPWVVRRRTG
jgi:hypothetical protein